MAEDQAETSVVVMIDRAIARHGYEIYADGKEVGIVTSGGISPTLGVNIGLAYIDNSFKIEDTIQIKIRDKFYEAVITQRPFVEKVNKIIR